MCIRKSEGHAYPYMYQIQGINSRTMQFRCEARLFSETFKILPILCISFAPLKWTKIEMTFTRGARAKMAICRDRSVANHKIVSSTRVYWGPFTRFVCFHSKRPHFIAESTHWEWATVAILCCLFLMLFVSEITKINSLKIVQLTRRVKISRNWNWNRYKATTTTTVHS